MQAVSYKAIHAYNWLNKKLLTWHYNIKALS